MNLLLKHQGYRKVHFQNHPFKQLYLKHNIYYQHLFKALEYSNLV